jgi:CRP-like cAMP-binding protein
MATNDERMEKLKKLKALADRGIGGEKDNAAKLLAKMCEKYGISLEDVSGEDAMEMHWFVHKQGDLYKRLMNQVMYRVFDDNRPIYKRGQERILGAYCTAAEAVEVEMDYDFYLKALKEDMKRLYSMFIQKNKIFPPTFKSDAPDTTEITDEDIAMYNGLTRHSRTLQIE